GTPNFSSVALGLLTRLMLPLPPPQSPPISTLPPPARPDASMRALASLMCSPLTRIVPPCVPFCLPAADSVPEILMVWAGAPAGLLAEGGGAQHDHAVAAANRVGFDHAAGVDDGIDDGARGRGGEFDTPAVGSDLAIVRDQRFERPAGRDI